MLSTWHGTIRTKPNRKRGEWIIHVEKLFNFQDIMELMWELWTTESDCERHFVFKYWISFWKTDTPMWNESHACNNSSKHLTIWIVSCVDPAFFSPLSRNCCRNTSTQVKTLEWRKGKSFSSSAFDVVSSLRIPDFLRGERECFSIPILPHSYDDEQQISHFFVSFHPHQTFHWPEGVKISSSLEWSESSLCATIGTRKGQLMEVSLSFTILFIQHSLFMTQGYELGRMNSTFDDQRWWCEHVTGIIRVHVDIEISKCRRRVINEQVKVLIWKCHEQWQVADGVKNEKCKIFHISERNVENR